MRTFSEEFLEDCFDPFAFFFLLVIFSWCVLCKGRRQSLMKQFFFKEIVVNFFSFFDLRKIIFLIDSIESFVEDENFSFVLLTVKLCSYFEFECLEAIGRSREVLKTRLLMKDFWENLRFLTLPHCRFVEFYPFQVIFCTK